PLGGDGVAHGVGDVQRAGAVVDGDLEHLAHEVEVRAGRVLGRELDVVGVAASVRHRLGRLGLHLVGGHAQLVAHVDLAGGQEDVDARPVGRLDGLPAAV